MSNKYAVISVENFNEEMLVDYYPVLQRGEQWVIVEYNDQENPSGQGWHIFEGENANRKCAKFLRENEN